MIGEKGRFKLGFRHARSNPMIGQSTSRSTPTSSVLIFHSYLKFTLTPDLQFPGPGDHNGNPDLAFALRKTKGRTSTNRKYDYTLR